ncbi:hypothetical protein HWV62_36462 [Athelia sp. TMB]|nr:hypothetical protein HWV62_36462 [Athelia sp. TMB]
METVSHIAVLPVEIISSIFVLIFQAPEQDWREAGRAAPFEIVISQVCSLWRCIALAIPQLWTRIVINVPRRHMLDITTRYLARSSVLPLRLSIALELLGRLPEVTEQLRTICNSLAFHIVRWKELRVSFASHLDFACIARWLPAVPAPLLETLQIDSRSTDTYFSAMPVLGLSAPALRELRLSGTGSPILGTSLATVTKIHIQEKVDLWGKSCVIYSRLLSQTRRLTHLVVNGDIIEAWPAQNVSFALPALLRLDVRLNQQRGGDRLMRLLSEMNAPRLERLLLENVRERDLQRFTLEDAFRPAKFPVLRSLTLLIPIGTSEMFPETMADTLVSAFPFITHFSYNSGKLDLADVWPRLHTLTLLCGTRSQNTLVAAIKERVNAGYALAKLRLPGGLLTGGQREELGELLEVEELAVGAQRECVAVERWPGLLF